MYSGANPEYVGVRIKSPVQNETIANLGIIPTLLQRRAGNQSLVALVVALLQKETITPVPSNKAHHRFYSTSSLVQKKSLCSIWNLKGFSSFLKCLPFCMLCSSVLPLSIQSRGWFSIWWIYTSTFLFKRGTGGTTVFSFRAMHMDIQSSQLACPCLLAPSQNAWRQRGLAPLHHQGIISWITQMIGWFVPWQNIRPRLTMWMCRAISRILNWPLTGRLIALVQSNEWNILAWFWTQT